MRNKQYTPEQAYQLFFRALLHDRLEEIVQTAHEIFESPVLLTDESYRLVCQVPQLPIGNPIWDTLLKEKVLPLETVWQYDTSYLSGYTEVYEPFYVDWGPAADSPRIFAEVYEDKRIYGHAAIFLQQNELQAYDLQIARIMTEALLIGMRRRTGGAEYGALPTHLLEMLHAPVPSPAHTTAVARLREHLPGGYLALAALLGKQASQTAFAARMLQGLAQKRLPAVAVLDGNSIVVLLGNLPSTAKQTALFKPMQEIINFFAGYHMVCGSSEPFVDIAEMPWRYRQALLTAQLAGRDDLPYATYRDVAPRQLFLAASQADLPWIYIHPVLQQLYLHDLQQGSAYFATLEAYCKSFYNKDATAIQLGIHRNTLLYRLNKIRELYDLDYEQEQVAQQLLISFLLWEMR